MPSGVTPSRIARKKSVWFHLPRSPPGVRFDPPLSPVVPAKYGWESLLKREGDELEAHYRHILESLGSQPGMLGEIFKKARPDIQNPATLHRLIVDLIEPVKWSSMDADVKGDVYEGLLKKSAEESPKGAGQYFTPRQLIKAIVDVMRPGPEDTICDPACGTGGFLLAAREYVQRHEGKDLDPEVSRTARQFQRGPDRMAKKLAEEILARVRSLVGFARDPLAFVAGRFVVCTFVPRPFESDPEALKLPFFHNNDDYEEVIFYHKGSFFSRDNIHPGMMTVHPSGFTHGPHPKALKSQGKKTRTDEYAVMLDGLNPIQVLPAGEAVEWRDYWKSWMEK